MYETRNWAGEATKGAVEAKRRRSATLRKAGKINSLGMVIGITVKSYAYIQLLLVKRVSVLCDDILRIHWLGEKKTFA